MLKLIIIIIILIAALSYFGISIRSVVESDLFQSNFSYIWNWVKHIWNNYLIGPAKYLWYDVIVNLLWDSFVENMNRIKNGRDIEMIE